MFYVTCRRSDTPAFLYNVEAATRGDAVRYGRNMFNRLPDGNVLRELYSLRNCYAIMLDVAEARFISWSVQDDDDV